MLVSWAEIAVLFNSGLRLFKTPLLAEISNVDLFNFCKRNLKNNLLLGLRIILFCEIFFALDPEIAYNVDND